MHAVKLWLRGVIGSNDRQWAKSGHYEKKKMRVVMRIQRMSMKERVANLVLARSET
jgi:hypothetical protein